MNESRPSLTPEQIAAIETRDAAIALSAGAGCGKTFVLTRRFLTHLAPSPAGTGGRDPLAEVVAITFTDRAAREMRDRIRTACSEQLTLCADDEVEHWSSILGRIDAARISTIHSFCGAFLRRHAVEAAVDPQFRLLDESTAKAFQQASVARSVRRLLEEADPDCMRLLFEYGLDTTQQTVQALVTSQTTIEAARFAQRTAREIADDWRRRYREVFLPGLVGELGDSPLVARILELLRENEPAHAAMQKRRAFLLERLPRLSGDDFEAALVELAAIREEALVKGGGGKSAWSSEQAYDDVRDALERLRKAIDRIRGFAIVDEDQLERSAEISAAAARVAGKASADFAAAKDAAGVLDFDDLLVRARDLLRGSEAARREASASIAALLVDEFQDTDPVQSEIVETLAGGNLSDGRLFVVGDAKQSIYRFRRADPRVFADMRDKVPTRGRLPLTVNFRSQPAVITFVNSVFAPVLKEQYEPLRAHREQLSPGPCIEFLLATAGPDEAAGDRRRREAEWLAGRIRQLLDDPTPRIPETDVQTKETVLRRVRAGDIAVLFRALSDVAIYEDVFRRQGIDYYLVGGRSFFAQQEVYDLVNLCAFLCDPGDDVSLAGVLRSPFFSLSDDALCALAARGPSLIESLDAPPPPDLDETDREQIGHASRVLGGLLATKDRLPLAALLQTAVESTGYDASLLHEFLGRRKVANLRKLFEMARQFDRAGFGTLSDFARRLRDSIVEEAPEALAATHPEASDVVRLMTVHQSKGSEFPVVIVADMDRSAGGQSRGDAVYDRELGPLLRVNALGDEKPQHIALDMHRECEAREELDEVVRLLYVAMTRAADYLILSAAPEHKGPRSHWLKLLAERFDLDTGLPRRDPYLDSFGAARGADRDAIPEIRVHHEEPEATTRRAPEARRAPLSQFRALVEEGEPATLPELMRPVEPVADGVRPGGRRKPLSVSAIEQADAFLRGARRLRPEPDAPFDQREETHDPTIFGTVVHDVIERLESREPADIDAMVRVAINGLSPSAAQSVVAEAVRKRIQTFVDSDAWSERAQADQCFREVDFLLRWPVDAPAGSELAVVGGKLDCLMQSPAGWKIVDYKTGRLALGDPAELLELFGVQLVLYAEAVRAMTGRIPESIEIVAVHDEVRRFPVALWPEFLAATKVRIEAAIRSLTAP